MKRLATASLWFLAAWVVYDMSAYALGLPRQITPMIALAAAVAVYKALTSDGSRAATMLRLPRIGAASLQ